MFLIKKNSTNGFTILELIIVVIIVGVLTSLAIPKFSNMIERSRSMEALNVLKEFRSQMEICYLGKRNFAQCIGDLVPYQHQWSDNPNSHFIYGGGTGGLGVGYSVIATRNTYELNTAIPPGSFHCDEGGGASSSACCGHYVWICVNTTAKTVKVDGSGVYEGI